MARDEITHEIEGRVEFTTAKSRLVEDNFSGTRYWVPKSQTYDMNPCSDDGMYILVVSDWWFKKRHEFEVQPREE